MLVRLLLVEPSARAGGRSATTRNVRAIRDPISNSAKPIYACGRPEDTAAPIVIVVVSFDGFGSDHILPARRRIEFTLIFLQLAKAPAISSATQSRTTWGLMRPSPLMVT